MSDTHRSFRTWFPHYVPADGTRMRLFCFPHAGASALVFHGWQRLLGPHIAVAAAELPGRWGRMNDAPFEAIEPLVDELAGAVGELAREPFALFGHSMGSLIAFELARTLRARTGALPVLLIASGRGAPHVNPHHRGWHLLPDQALLERVRASYGGIPDALMADPEVRLLVLRSLRADLCCLENYRHVQQDPLACPILALGGSADHIVPDFTLDAWADHSTLPLLRETVAGGHFFVTSARDAVCELIRNRLAA